MKTNLPKTLPQNQEEPKSLLHNKYLEIKIPRISFKDTPINAYLVIALIIFAFLLGMLTNKVLFLQNELKTQSTNNTQTGLINNAAAAGNNLQPTSALPAKVNVALGHLPILGNSDAKVTVIEFSDLQCPFCKRFVDETYQQIYDDYIKTGKIKFAYRHYPLSSIHPNAQKAAEASECANEQNKFWEYHDLLFKNQSTWSPLAAADAVSTFTDYAGGLSLNTTQFRGCLDTGKYRQQVDKDTADGSKVGVDGTPAFFINGLMITGAQPFTQFQQLVEQELKK